jgi:hypothetical protein
VYTRGDGRGVGDKDEQEKLSHAQRDSMYKDCPHVASRRSANPIQLIVSLSSDGNDDEDEGYLGACVANSAVARAVRPWYTWV